MPNFRYKARDKFGHLVTGAVSGDDKNSAAGRLSSMGYVLLSLEESREMNVAMPKALESLSEIFNKISLAELNVFTRQILTLQKAGVPLLSSLDIMEKQTKNKAFKKMIKDIAADVEHGTSLSEAMAKYPRVFNDFYVSMVKAGEASGQLDEILSRVLDFGEKELDTRNRVKAAVRYPMITLAALGMAFIVIVTFVIPRFAPIFAQFKTQLPLPTRILLNASIVLKNYWYIVIAAAAGLAMLFVKFINTKKGRLKWDSFKLNAPVFGNVITMIVMSRFTRTMAILIKSGLPILQVLDMASHTAANAVIAKVVEKIIVSVKEGKGVAEPMRTSNIFPPMVVNMVSIGESSGKIDELLMSASDYYDRESDYIIKNLTTIIEPIIVVILGAMVLLMALAIFLPMWNLISLFKH